MVWICSLCSNVNDENYSCSKCHNINYFITDDVTYQESEHFNNNTSSINNAFSWNCSSCTFTNSHSTAHCEMCHNAFQPQFDDNYRPALRQIRMQSIDETVTPDDVKKDLAKARETRECILAQLQGSSKYTDPEFSPIPASIGISKSSPLNKFYQSYQFADNVVWRRPEDLQGDEYSDSLLEWAVTRNPSSEDIVQGLLGNCWLLTGLALIADRSNLLDQILITKDIDSHGIYQVRLCKDGMWTIVTIDDLFPTKHSNQMMYSRANRKQLWVSIIEKAAAKLYGSYECLTLGYCADGLSTLTGSPCETFKLSDFLGSPSMEASIGEESFGPVENISLGWENEEKDTTEIIWAKLLSAKDANFVMCVSCGSQTDNPFLINKLQQFGLSNLHAYAILDVKDIPSVNLRLLRLKNPWARLAWKGDWSDNHHLWNTLPQEIRDDLQPLGVSGESCGVFWISWNDVLKYFFALDICLYQPFWHELRMHTHLPWPVWIHSGGKEFKIKIDTEAKVAIPESSSATKMFSSPIPEIEENNTCAVLTILEPTQLQIVLWQSSSRANKKKPVDLLLIICKDYEEKVGNLVGSSNRQTSSYVTCDLFLDPGTYTIFYMSFYYWQAELNPISSSTVFFDYSNVTLFECSLSVHSSKPVLLNRAILTPKMIPAVIAELALRKGRKQLFGKIEVFTLMKGYSGMIMLVVNPSNHPDIKCTSDNNGSTNVRHSRGHGVTKTDDIISPGFCQITTVLTQEDAYSSLSLQHKYTASISHSKTLTEHPELLDQSDRQHWPPIQLVLHQPMRM